VGELNAYYIRNNGGTAPDSEAHYGEIYARITITITGETVSSISGRVADDSHNPISGVNVSTNNGHTVITDNNGNYTLSDLSIDTYTLTPTKAGCLFMPATRVVSVPPDATGQDFEARCEFGISGSVLDSSGNPFAGVQISAGAGGIATTVANGQYAFAKLVSGTYTLVPTLSGYTFQPATRVVTLPPDAIGQNFVMLASPVSLTLPMSGTTNLPASLTYTDTQGLPTTIEFPADAVTQTTTIKSSTAEATQGITLVLTPTLATGGAGLAFAGHAFNLAVYRNGNLQPGLTFNKPVTITIYYSAPDIRVVSDEGQLSLRWWTGSEWENAADTCTPPSTYNRDSANGVLSVPICHLSLFSLFGPTHQIYLPIVLRNQ
jgi:hypothetical protein